MTLPDGAWIGDYDPDDFRPDGGWGSANEEAARARVLREARSTTLLRAQGGAKTRDQSIRLALQLASGVDVVFMCASKEHGEEMRKYVEAALRWGGVFPVAKRMKKFKVHVVKKAKL